MRSRVVVAAVAAASVLAWVTSTLLAAGHGLDLTDESFYLVTYRWWDTYDPTFTGTQYLFGPLFERLGYRIDGLRVARLLLHLLANTCLAMTVLAWLRHQIGVAPGVPTRAAVALSVVAGGASAYIWLPMSAGYNDVTILAAVMSSAAICHAATTSTWSHLSVFLAGVSLAAAVVAKWTSVGMVVLFVIALALLVRRRGVGAVLLTAVSLLGGAAALLAYVHATVPLSDLVGALREANARLASSTNSPTGLVVDYLRNALTLAIPALALGLVLAWVWFNASRRVPAREGSIVALCICIVPVVAIVVTDRVPAGGPGQDSVTLTLWSLFAFATFSALLSDRDRLRTGLTRAFSPTGVVVTWLLLAPWLHGFGTGNPVHLLAISAAGPWLAVLAHAWAQGLQAGRTGHGVAPLTGALLAAVIVIGWAAATANLVSPYRSPPIEETTTIVADNQALAGLRLSPQQVDAFRALRTATAGLDVDHVLVLDELPGLSLILDAPPYAEAWTSASDVARTHAQVEAVCEEKGAPSLIVMTRTVTAEDINALRECGTDFYADYRKLPVADPLLEISVYALRLR